MSSNLNKAFENSALYKFLGPENVQDLRQMVKEMLVEEIRDELRDCQSYIISPDDITEILNGIIEEAVDEIKDAYKNELANMLSKKLANFNFPELILK